MTIIKPLKDHAMLMLWILIAYLLIKDTFPVTGVLILTSYWYLRTRSKSCFMILVLLASFLIPRYLDAMDFTKGRCIEAHASYSVLENNRKKILVYTKEPLLLDAEYVITEEPVKIESAKGFFRFDFGTYCQRHGICYCVSDSGYELIQEHFSIRSAIQKRIARSFENDRQILLNKLLLNITPSDDDLSGYMYQNGFSYSAVLAILDYFLKYFLDIKKRRKVVLTVNVLLMIMYYCPVLLVQSFIMRILSFFKMDQIKKNGIGMTITLILFPFALYSLSFLIPFIYRCASISEKDKKIIALTGILFVQSVFFQKMNLFMSLCYPFLRLAIGFSWLCGMLETIFPMIPFTIFVTSINDILAISEKTIIPGSALGSGLIFYFAILIALRKKEWIHKAAFFLLLLFQLSGLFHPFAEITFVNVGQGDAILIRGPFNSENILIDTGKPSQWKNLQAYLDGEGIRHLDALFITHGDDDHCGSQYEVIDKYQPDQVILFHHEEICTGRLCFYNLNDIESEDENESSLAEYFNLNGMKIVLTGDMNAYAEEEIVKKYAELDCTILKLSHHGSKTGSSEQFLDALRPEVAIISSGSYSLYHHPSPEVIQRLLKRHIPYFDTKEEGDIRILCIGPLNLLMTSNGKCGLIQAG